MLHIFFALYVASLLSGILLLSLLANNPTYRCALGFREFIAQYLLITAFVFIVAVFLYLSVNVLTTDVFRQNLFKVYVVVILLFLGFLPATIEKYNAKIYPVTPPFWFKWLVQLIGLYAIAGAVSVWWLSHLWYAPVIGFSVALLISVLIIDSLQGRKHYREVFKGPTARRVSRAMILQSLCLPAIEVVFWSEHLSRDGFAFSLPVLYLVNNVLLWIYRDALMPGAGSPVPLRGMESLLSPKEREIARALAQGLSNKQIAAKQGISQSTVKNHIYSIFKKCNVTSRLALIACLRAD